MGSMSRAGNPYDNTIAESFMKTLKYEEVYARGYTTMAHLIDHLPHFLDELYHRQRLHSTLGYRPPEEFETLNRRAMPAARPRLAPVHPNHMHPPARPPRGTHTKRPFRSSNPCAPPTSRARPSTARKSTMPTESCRSGC